MKLSVVIVNYNVQYFLEQCLRSVEKACRTLCAGLNDTSEIFVVDNHSADDSAGMVQEQFPKVQLIANSENAGFSRANNQAICRAKGEYILLLNPDTIVEEDTLSKAIRFMDEHPDAGGLGVMMIDGRGRFLPESRRALPTPGVAFFKMSGLAWLFPRSGFFNRYHLGHLDRRQTHCVDVLSGACMFLRRSALDKTGLLDEAFFMYGEDIDLSCRLMQAGYRNYYYPEARIIHYKGESTRKGSLNYVRMFYHAMLIFARKHFAPHQARMFSALIHGAIYFRASLSAFYRFAAAIALPITDALCLFAGMLSIKVLWEKYVRFPYGGHYPTEYLTIAVPTYLIVWLLMIFLSGGYDRPLRLSRTVRGVVTGAAIILIGYALLPENWRFSRAMILLGMVWSLFTLSLLRWVLNRIAPEVFPLEAIRGKRTALAAGQEEAFRVSQLLKQIPAKPRVIGYIVPRNGQGQLAVGKPQHDLPLLGTLLQLPDIIRMHRIREIIFCASDVTVQTMMDTMTRMKPGLVEFKTAPPEGISVFGSDVIHAINKTANRRNKRLLDIAVSLCMLCTFPVTGWAVRNPAGFFLNIFRVLAGINSWVGYIRYNESESWLPAINPGILNPGDMLSENKNDLQTIQHLNLTYSKDYRIVNDLVILWKGFREVGRKINN